MNKQDQYGINHSTAFQRWWFDWGEETFCEYEKDFKRWHWAVTVWVIVKWYGYTRWNRKTYYGR